MKAVVLTGLRKLEIREMAAPRLEGDMDVMLKTACVGVCGSDVHYYRTGRIGSEVAQYPFVLGHEFAATVESVGAGVTHVKAGDTVAVDPAMSCRRCDQCISGRHHTCRNLRFLGCPTQAQGCLREFVAVPADCCYPVESRTTLEQAALVEPFSIGLYAVRMAGLIRTHRLGILGAGPIGLSVLLAARKAEGVHRIYVTDKIDARLNAASEAGALWVGNPLRQDIVGDISGREPLLLDAVIECCGEQDALDQAVRLLKPGGKLLIVGIPDTNRVSFDIDAVRRKEICIQNVRRQNECIQAALDLIESGAVCVDSLVTHRFSVEEAGSAFELAAGYKDGIIKAMIQW